MNIFSRSLIIAALGLTAVGCVSVSPVGTGATSNNGPTKKMGESGCVSILHFSKIGDCGVDTAKKNGGITAVHHVDEKVTDYWIFAVMKTQVYGN